MGKKILYIGGFELPDRNAAAQRVVANSKIFKQLGYDIYLVGLSPNLDTIDTPFEYEGLHCINIKYPKTITEWFYHLFTLRNYRKIIETFNPNIVIAYNHPAFSLRCLLNHNQTRGIKTLSDCTEWYNAGGGLFFRQIKKWDTNYRMNVVQARLDGVIVISKFLEQFYINKGTKTLLLPPLVDKSEKKWDDCYKNNKILRLIYAGSTSRHKDRLDFIISLLNKVAKDEKIEMKFNILGMTSDQYKKMYSLTGDIPSFVSFKGRVSHVEAINDLKQSDFQIFFRDNNLVNTAGFPTKFVETISSRCLVLTNKSSNLEDYLVDGVNGFWIDTTNDDTIYRTLVRALKVPRNTLDEMRSKMDVEIFDYRNYVNKTENFINQL